MDILEITRKIRIERIKILEFIEKEKSCHINRARNNVKIGGIKKNETEKGIMCSLFSNFKASAIGCKIPIREILLGPLRIWVYPIILRSIKV